MRARRTSTAGELRVALDAIRVRDNVRELDQAHVDNLAQTIALRGLLVPLIARSLGDSAAAIAARATDGDVAEDVQATVGADEPDEDLDSDELAD